MIEHRLIERMIGIVQKELARVKSEGTLNVAFVDTYVDFARTYADRCHHGKEEDILFRDLKSKSLSKDHARILTELIDEHVQARKRIRRLVEARSRYEKGDASALSDAIEALDFLVELYPRHIEKEDKRFFIPTMSYFSAEELERMLKEFYDFDRNLIHERYKAMVEKVEKGS